jgi:hypothetical protein
MLGKLFGKTAAPGEAEQAPAPSCAGHHVITVEHDEHRRPTGRTRCTDCGKTFGRNYWRAPTPPPPIPSPAEVAEQVLKNARERRGE